MGIIAYIYDNPLGNFSNNGISANHIKVLVVNADGPFTAKECSDQSDLPLVKIVKGNIPGTLKAVVVGEMHIPIHSMPMFGGAAATAPPTS